MANAAQSRIAKLKDMQEEVSKLISWTTNFTAHWEDAIMQAYQKLLLLDRVYNTYSPVSVSS